METQAITNFERAFRFREKKLTVVMINEEPHWLVPEIEEALGYAPKSLPTLIRREWEDELEEGVDFIVAQGEQLSVIKRLVEGYSTSSKHARSITLLTEQGLTIVTLLSRKPIGRALRRWLAADVIPSIRRTGKYELDERAIKRIGLRKREGFQLLAKALEAEVIGKTFAERYVMQGLAAIEGTTPEGPRLLDIATFLESKDLDRSEIRSASSLFGKKLKAAYVERYDRAPEKAFRFINGAERSVFCYTEDDLDLFEAVFDEMFEIDEDTPR